MSNNNVPVKGSSNVDINGSNEDDGAAVAAGLHILADVSSKAKKIPTWPKRPPNAYILFSKANRKGMKRECPDLSFQELSKRMGKLWKAKSYHEKRPYIVKARREAEAHKIKYPGYVYCPAKARLRKRERERRQLTRRKCRNLQAANAPQCSSSTDVQGLVHFGSANTTDQPQAGGEMFGAAEMINMERAANNEIHLALNVPNNVPKSTGYPLEPETTRGSREAESVQANVPFEAGNISVPFYHNGCFRQYPAGPSPYPLIVHYAINHQSYGVPVVDSQVPPSPSRSAWSSASHPATYVIGTHVPPSPSRSAWSSASHPATYVIGTHVPPCPPLFAYHHVPNHATSPCVPPPFHAHRYENSPYAEVLSSEVLATIHRRSDSAMFDEASSAELTRFKEKEEATGPVSQDGNF